MNKKKVVLTLLSINILVIILFVLTAKAVEDYLGRETGEVNGVTEEVGFAQSGSNIVVDLQDSRAASVFVQQIDSKAIIFDSQASGEARELLEFDIVNLNIPLTAQITIIGNDVYYINSGKLEYEIVKAKGDGGTQIVYHSVQPIRSLQSSGSDLYFWSETENEPLAVFKLNVDSKSSSKLGELVTEETYYIDAVVGGEVYLTDITENNCWVFPENTELDCEEASGQIGTGIRDLEVVRTKAEGGAITPDLEKIPESFPEDSDFVENIYLKGYTDSLYLGRENEDLDVLANFEAGSSQKKIYIFQQQNYRRRPQLIGLEVSTRDGISVEVEDINYPSTDTIEYLGFSQQRGEIYFDLARKTGDRSESRLFSFDHTSGQFVQYRLSDCPFSSNICGAYFIN